MSQQSQESAHEETATVKEPAKYKKRLSTALIGGVVFFAISLIIAANYPAVESLGTKVRLPVFHGAMTWASLTLFGLLFLVGLFSVFSKSERGYFWAAGLRTYSVFLWLLGTVLGFLAASRTWDFTGSKTPALELMMADPRLIAQVVVALIGLAVIILPSILESRRTVAIADTIYPAVAFGALRWAMSAGQALHPDSPVFNSPEFKIKALFVGMYGFLLLAGIFFSYGIRTYAEKRALNKVEEA